MDQHQLFNPALVVIALRDNGYKSPAFALAELIDNSVQAGANHIDLITVAVPPKRGQRGNQLTEVAVLDNGSGMSPEVLQLSLQFGNGTRLDDHTGIGRFGMGLPSASCSQAKRVDVYSWQDGEGPQWTYLCTDEVASGRLSSVPKPEPKQIPLAYQEYAKKCGSSGTLVVWSDLDRLGVKQPTTLWRNTEFEIGRMYRRQISSAEDFRIRHVDVTADNGSYKCQAVSFAKANDPLYLIAPSSCPAPFDKKPMFIPFGEHELCIEDSSGTKSVVRLTFSIHGPDAGPGKGGSDPGQHARKNVGLSVVRADRELELQSAWSNPSEPRDRWWGAEVDFPPQLDHIFGVTNNKQAATKLAAIASKKLADIAEEEGYSNADQLLKEMKERDLDRYALLEVKRVIDDTIAGLRSMVKKARANSKSGGGSSATSAEGLGSEVANTRMQKGKVGETDSGLNQPSTDRVEGITQLLEESGMKKSEAQSRALLLVENKIRYEFIYEDASDNSFFTPKRQNGITFIKINTSHPVFDHFLHPVKEAVDSEDPQLDDLKIALKTSDQAFKLILESWVRMEEESVANKDELMDTRQDWGRMARDFVRKLSGD